MTEKIERICHNAIKINSEKIIYIDPFRVKESFNDADIVFCTHSHYDHFSPEDIEKVMNKNTEFVFTKDCEMKGINRDRITFVEPESSYEVCGVKFSTVCSYNKIKPFHPKRNRWVGYIIELEGKKYYIAGDTDFIKEMENIKCDVAFLPIGGIYTMNIDEAVKAVKLIKPHIVIPTHYGEIVGKEKNGMEFKNMLGGMAECRVI